MSAPIANGHDATKISSPANAGASKPPKTNSVGKALESAHKQASPVDGQSKKQQPQKAWHGHNPITQRPSPNGTEKPLPTLPSHPQLKSNGEPHADKLAHNALLFLLANMTGHDTTLTLKNGEQFTGIFSGGSFESSTKNQYVLRMVKRTKFPSHQAPNGVLEVPGDYIGEGEDHVMSFEVQDTVDLCTKDVITTSAQPMKNGSASAFRTDAEISAREPRMPRERALQRWEPSGDSNVDLSLESSGTTGWDQFEANKKLYGVESSYDENIYTTQIDRSNPQYRQREAIAEKVAREIEGSTPANSHIAEERTRDADRTDGLDEEDKYSGVTREDVSLPKRGAGSYVPPSQRPITTGPTVPGAPYDPAIISSQLAKPSVSPAPIQDKSVDSSNAGKLEAREGVAKDIVTGLPTVQQWKKPSESTTEDHVRATTDAFKQFANTEKLRIRAAQEAKKSTARHEKNVKLNDLKKFAANFKLKSRVPDDLVPILAKDREKQVEIQRKADEAAQMQEQKAKEKTAVSPVPPSTAVSSPTAPVNDARVLSNQHRLRVSGQLRSTPASIQNQPPRAPPGQRPQQGMPPRGNLAPLEPLPANLHPRMPVGGVELPPISPSAATRMNVKAKPFEFHPGVGNFTPSGASPSPQRIPKQSSEPTVTFFGKHKNSSSAKARKDLDEVASVVTWMLTAEWPETFKRDIAANDGVPPPWRTDPTWPVGTNVSYKDHKDFKTRVPSQGRSPMHMPNHSNIVPHPHQLPAGMPVQHLPGSGRGPYFGHQQQQGQGPHFDHRMSQFAPNGSVQNSPRFQGAQVAPFNGQMQQMQMPHFNGPPMPGYGVSPSMQHRQMQMPPGPQMMMAPGQQYGQMPPMRPNFPQSGSFGGPQMGGQMMSNSPSGGYMNGPMPQQPQPYSPMPPHAQLHMGHMQPGAPGGYGGSPRPPMMQHQGSHQGYQPPMHGGGPPFGGSPGQHPYHLQQGRQLSSGHGGPFPQMTPRQQPAVPQHPSPGMGGMVVQGDEGK